MEATVTTALERDRKSNFNNVEIEVMLEMVFKNSKTIAISTKAVLSATCCRVGSYSSRMTVVGQRVADLSQIDFTKTINIS